jgi:signal transduction histidine kinase
MTMAGPAPRQPKGRLVAAALALAGVVFVADLRVAHDVVVPTFYVVVVLFGLRSPRRRFTLAVAAGATLLTALGGAVTPSGGEPWLAVADRSLAIVAIWATALAVVRHKTVESRLSEERRRAEAALRKQQALAQLGEMAAVVAHEVRNPLAGIRATLQVLSTRLPAKDQPTVSSLYARIDALNEMTESLLLFSRPRAPRLEPLALTPLLREAAGLLRGDGRWARVQVELSGEDACVHADPLLLRGVFLNVLLNAAQAMGGSGTVRVRIASADGWCRVSITDAGPGIPAKVLERVFEPFFTTKHRGTGLGLAVVRRQVEAHGGEVTIACPPDGGTVVTVTLPLSAAG